MGRLLFVSFFLDFFVAQNSQCLAQVSFQIPSDVLTDKLPFPDSLMINIKKSKTDQFKRGFTIVLGKADSHICPVAAILTYLHLTGQKNGPMFIFKDGSPLT